MVYVVQEKSGINLSSAAIYGELKTLIRENVSTFSSGFVTNKLKVELSSFSDEDFLLLIGDPVFIGIAVLCAGHWNQGKIKLLKWDRETKRYFPIFVNLYQKEGNSGLTE